MADRKRKKSSKLQTRRSQTNQLALEAGKSQEKVVGSPVGITCLVLGAGAQHRRAPGKDKRGVEHGKIWGGPEAAGREVGAKAVGS